MEWLLLGLVVLLVFSVASMGADSAKRDETKVRLRTLPNFTPSYAVVKTPIAGIPCGVAFDAGRRKAVLVTGDTLLPIDLDDIMSCDVVAEPKSGSVMARFVINDLRRPAHFIDFIEMTGGGDTPTAFALREVGELQAYFRVLKEAAIAEPLVASVRREHTEIE